MGVIMEFDIKKLEKMPLSKSNIHNINFTAGEIDFMANIFNTIINSDNYDVVTEYLAGVNGMSVSDIKFIRNVYYLYFASREDKKIYNDKVKGLKKEKRRSGFINLSVVLTSTIFIGIVGITLAILIYNL